MARNARPTSSGRSMMRASRTDGFEIITAPGVHPVFRVLGLLIRLRVEITTLMLSFALLAVLFWWLPPAAAAAVIAVLIAVLVAMPACRRFVGHRGAAVMTRHRLRQVLVERRCLNFSRHAPLFLWSHPTEVGETVWLLLRAGISPADVEDQAEWIASGCFARDTRVTALRSMTAIVRVEVIRRDPLATELIASELADWATTTGTPAPRGARVVPPRPANRPTPRPTLDRSDGVPVVVDIPSPAPAPEDAPAEPVPARAGDWSDYV